MAVPALAEVYEYTFTGAWDVSDVSSGFSVDAHFTERVCASHVPGRHCGCRAAPSPDWFVDVSDLLLRDANGLTTGADPFPSFSIWYICTVGVVCSR